MKKKLTDTQRLDWLEEFFSISSENSKGWKEFYTYVTEWGFRKAIDFWMEKYK